MSKLYVDESLSASQAPIPSRKIELPQPIRNVVTQTAHGFDLSAPMVKMGNDGSYILAQADDLSTLATHMIVAVLDEDHVEVARTGIWSIVPALGGVLYLSTTTPGGITATEPTSGVRQVIGRGDGSKITLDIQTHVVAFAEPTEAFPTDLIVGLSA
jgi:hypothetical protein